MPYLAKAAFIKSSLSSRLQKVWGIPFPILKTTKPRRRNREMCQWKERGGCKESHTAIEEAEKENQCECLHAKMQECMETHSDYYHPIFAAAKEAGDKAIHREVQAFIIPSSVGRDLKEWRGPKVEEELEKFMGFMERGGCKESLMALVHCDMEDCAKEDRDKCMSVVRECLEAHSDYYQPYFKAGAEAAEEAMVKHIIEAFSTTSDQPIAKAGEDESDERFLDFMKGGACNELFTALLDLDCGE